MHDKYIHYLHYVYVLYGILLVLAVQWRWCELAVLCNQIFHPRASTEMRIFQAGIGKVRVGFISIITGIIIKGLP